MSAGDQARDTFEGWCVLELMGRRKLAGFVREQTVAGGAFLRLDVYPGQAALPTMTQFYAAAALYGITPISEDLARRFAARQTQDPPIAEWELPRLPAGPTIDAQAGPAATGEDDDDHVDCDVVVDGQDLTIAISASATLHELMSKALIETGHSGERLDSWEAREKREGAPLDPSTPIVETGDPLYITRKP